MKKLLTVVIPAYNMEKYLHRCLDSIITDEVMDRVQVLVVNDGSNDRTSEIAHEYENKYPHYIQVIDKVNGNYGSCMNVGISLAEGKYFRTLDADDWYDTSNYIKFVDELEKTDADMILTEITSHNKKGNIVEGRYNRDLVFYKDIELTFDIVNDPTIIGMYQVQVICYKTDVIRKSGLKWSEKVFYSDAEFDYWPLKSVKIIRILPISVYQYDCERDGQSTSVEVIRKNFHSFEVVANKLVDDYVTNPNIDNPIRVLQERIIKCNLLSHIYTSIIFNGYNNKDFINHLDVLLSKNKVLYDYTNNIHNYRDIKYVDAYRHNKLKFALIRLDYLIRSNKILRKILRK